MFLITYATTLVDRELAAREAAGSDETLIALVRQLADNERRPDLDHVARVLKARKITMADLKMLVSLELRRRGFHKEFQQLKDELAAQLERLGDGVYRGLSGTIRQLRQKISEVTSRIDANSASMDELASRRVHADEKLWIELEDDLAKLLESEAALRKQIAETEATKATVEAQLADADKKFAQLVKDTHG